MIKCYYDAEEVFKMNFTHFFLFSKKKKEEKKELRVSGSAPCHYRLSTVITRVQIHHIFEIINFYGGMN